MQGMLGAVFFNSIRISSSTVHSTFSASKNIFSYLNIRNLEEKYSCCKEKYYQK